MCVCVRGAGGGSRGARLEVLVAGAQVDVVLLGRVEVLVSLWQTHTSNAGLTYSYILHYTTRVQTNIF